MSRKTSSTAHKRQDDGDEAFRLLFYNHPLPMWICDLETLAFLEVNDAAVKKYGYTRAAFLSMTLADICPAEDVPRLLKEVRQECPAWQQSGEWRHRLKDGTIIDVEITSHTLEFKGRPAALVMAQDITERRQAEEALKRSEELLRVTLTNISDPIFITDDDGNFTFICPNVDSILGYSTEEVQAMGNISKLVGDEPLRLEELEKKGEITNVERKIVDRHGRQIVFLMTVKRVSIGAGTRLYTLHDITERVQAEEALQESEARNRAILESLPDLVFVLDHEGTYLDYHAANPDALYVPPEQFLGRKVQEVLPQELAATFLGLIEQVVATGKIHSHEYHLPIAGQPRYFEARLAPCSSDKVLSIIREITERKQAEENLRRHAEELNALQAMVLDISSPHSLPKLLNLVVERAVNLLGAASGGLYLAEPERRKVRCVVSYNTKEDFTGTTLDYGVGAAGYVAETGQPLIIDDYSQWPGRAKVYEDKQPFRAVMSAPMLWQGQVSGVLHVLRDDASKKFTQGELTLLSLFANHAAVAVGNARLFNLLDQELTERMRAEEALRESEARYRRLAENAQDLIYRYEFAPQCGFAYVSPAAINFAGYSPEEYYADPGLVMKTVHPEDRPLLEQFLQSSGGFMQTPPLRWICKDGRVIWTEQRNVPIYDEGGNLIAVEGIARDITTRKQAEADIQQRNADLALLNAINSAANRGESLASILDLIATQTKRTFNSNGITLHLLDEEQGALVMQTPAISPSTQARIEKILGRPIPPIAHDLRKAHPYRQVLESRQGVLLTDRAQIQEFIAAYLEATTWTDKTRQRVKRLIPALVSVLGYQSVLVTPLLFGDELVGTVDMGSQDVFTEADLHRFEIIASQLTAVIQRKRAEEEIHRLNAELERRVEDRTRELQEAQEQLVRQEKLAVLGQLAGGVGHELRNPLAVISNAIYFLRLVQPEADEKVREYLRLIENETHNAEKIINDLLDFSRV
ncbi:MAG: PAS domain S-box protein, partial [Chloroflexota bacterium]